MHMEPRAPARLAQRCRSSKPRSYALLLRGEVYRFGCDPLAVLAQDLAIRSVDEMITRPLLDCGHRLDIILALDKRGCANDSLRSRLKRWPRVRLSWSVRASNQATNFRAALQRFRPLARRYDTLIVSRYDLRVSRQILDWPGCQDGESIGVAEPCEVQKWDLWNCSGDTLFVVPIKMLPAFDAAVGAPTAQASKQYTRWSTKYKMREYGIVTTNACFMTRGERASTGLPVGTGHGCYNALAQRVGYARVTHCWPRDCRLASAQCRQAALPRSGLAGSVCREPCPACQASPHTRQCSAGKKIGATNRTLRGPDDDARAQRLFGISSEWYQCCRHHGAIAAKL